MRKFCKYCQEQTDHFGDECLECYYVSDSEDDSSDYSEHESDREFINDDSESDYESESEDESDMEYQYNIEI